MTLGEGGSNQKMTKCDMGGGGIKNPDFRSDVLSAWPHREHTYKFCRGGLAIRRGRPQEFLEMVQIYLKRLIAIA